MNGLTIAALFVLLFIFTRASKEATKTNKKPKHHVPHIDCDDKAGKIMNPEFIAKCPAGCQEGKHRVYGTDIYASFSSVCSAAIHSGTITNAGGKILVRKVAGQSGYKGSFSNGIRSLSLPRWKESFIVAEGKAKRGVTYPAILDYVTSKDATDKTEDVFRKEFHASTVPQSTTTSTTTSTTATTTSTTTPEPTTTPPKPTTTPTTASTITITTVKPRPPVHRARDTGSSKIHPAYTSLTAASRQIQAAQGRGQNQAFKATSTFASNRNLPRTNAGVLRQDSAASVRKPTGASTSLGYTRLQQAASEKGQAAQLNPTHARRDWQSPNKRVGLPTIQRKQPDSSNIAPDLGYTWTADTYDSQVHSSRSGLSDLDRWVLSFDQSNQKLSEPEAKWKVVQEVSDTKNSELELAKPGMGLLETGTSKEEMNPRSTEPVSQGNQNCKVDLAFLIDGSWSIGKRRFRIQKHFLREVAQALDIGPVGPLMGVIQYGDDPSTEFSLKTYSNSRDVRAATEKIQQKGGFSNVGKALSFVNKNVFSDTNGNRGSAPNVAIALVDGWPTDKVEEASRLARESGINIFFVTIEAADENEKPLVVEPNFVDKAVCRTNGFFSINVPSWFSLHKIVQPLVKRVCDTDRLVCSKTCLNAADIAFVIDGSSSVGTGNFRTVLQFVANITKEFEISDTDTRVGAVQYTYEQRLEFGFDKHSTKQDVMNAVQSISYWSGGTSTGAAISYASEQLFSKSKPNKRKIMIVITDGRSYDDVRGPATAAHRNGVIAYAIGIAWAAHDELEAIATDPDKEHAFFVDEFDSLYKYVGKIIQNICTEFNSQPRN
ncbi:vitrin isoform X3 [Rhinatrema bivittatum]|uniref:vitrin isoform X3 n=1 Tax=Rhinatrema bivittatum TaxID=194408 RepID=UPI00112B2BAC|nr:vitrin isoform X3 [Rhinatrema bivittatum]